MRLFLIRSLTPCIAFLALTPARADDKVGGTDLDGAEAGVTTLEPGFFGANGSDQEVCKFPGNTDPVDLASGEFHMSRTDLVLPGMIDPLVIGFTYRNQRMYNGRWGYGWFFPYEMRIFPRSDGEFTWRLGTGEELVLGPGSPPSNHHVKFEFDLGGSPEYRITDEQTKEQYEFSTEGLLEVWRDSAENEIRFDWEEVAGAKVKSPISGRYGNVIALDYRITTIVGTLDDRLGGQFVNFTYYSSGPQNGRLHQLQDCYNRIVEYFYDADGNLKSVVSPSSQYEDENGGLVTQGRTTEYDYTSGFRVDEVGVPEHQLDHNLIKVTDDRGEICLENVYDSSDRVVSQSQHGSTSYLAYTLVNLIPTTEETDGNGFTHKHTIDAATGLRTKLVTVAAGFHGNGDYETIYTYNTMGETTLITLPSTLTEIGMVIDTFGNITTYDQRDSGGVPGNDITYMFEYETEYNRIKKRTDPLGQITEYFYDYEEGLLGQDLNEDGRTDQNNGRVVKIVFPDATLPDGTSQTVIEAKYQYSDAGQLTKSIDPEGKTVEYSYGVVGNEDFGLLTGIVVDSSGKALSTQLDYDGFGYLTAVTNPRGIITSFTNNALGEVVQIVAPENVQIKRLYDGVGNLLLQQVRNVDHTGAVQTPEWIGSRRAYNAWSRLTTITDDVTGSSTRMTQFSYDGLGQVTEVITPEGRRNRYAYDERGLLYRTTLGYGTAEEGTWQLAFDQNGKLKSQTDPDGRKTDWAYDDHVRLESMTDPEGNTVNYTINQRLELTNIDVTDIADGMIQRRVFSYDELGRLVEVTQSDPGTQSPIRSVKYFYRKDGLIDKIEGARSPQVTQFTYDTASRLESVTDPVGNLITYTLDANGNPAIVTSTEVSAAGNDIFDTVVFYDDLDRPQQIDRQESGGMGTLTTQLAYDTRSNLQRLTDPTGRRIDNEYDLADRLVARIVDEGQGMELNLRTEFGYDLDDLLTSVIDADLLTTTMVWDAQGRSTRWTYPDGSFEKMTYNGSGDLITHRAQDGLLTTLAYHPDRTLLSRTALARVETFTWNALGQPRTANVTGGGSPPHNLTFTYDSLNRLENEVQPFGTVAYEYDLDNNLTKLTYPGGFAIICAYDPINRLKTVTEVGGGTLMATYDWMGFDRVDKRTTGTGAGTITQDWGWDGYKRPVLPRESESECASRFRCNRGLSRRECQAILQPVWRSVPHSRQPSS